MIRAAGLALCVALGLAGCGGGGGNSGGGGGGSGDFPASGDRPAGDPSFLQGTAASADLLLIGFEGDGTAREGEGFVNLGTGVVSGASLAGRLNEGRTRIELDGGGWIDLTNPADTEHVRVVRATHAGGPAFFGVLGIPSLPSDLPTSGGVSYTGRTELLAVDSLRLYTLGGTASIAANFGTGRVRIDLGDLGGTAQGIATSSVAPTAVPATGRIVISDSVIAGATFAGGRATSAGLPFFLTRDANAGGTRGAFFGPGADEVGGRVIIVDQTADTQVIGTFVAE